jgi:hypothetical protein
MKYEEKRMNLFEVDNKYYLAHCISADYKLGAGIAVEFEKKFKLKNKLSQYSDGSYPTVIRINRVFNLITKAKYWHKPTLQSLRQTIVQMANDCLEYDIKYLAMPKIGCGLDKLSWGEVREVIKEVFDDTDIEILICSL